jgi:hypothetical protein
MSSWSNKRRHFTDKTKHAITESKSLENFTGTQYRLANNWFSIIPLDAFNTRPIHYL